jgi:hypothetical protein
VGSARNRITVNIAHSATMACIHQEPGSVKRHQASRCQVIHKPLRPASVTDQRA